MRKVDVKKILIIASVGVLIVSIGVIVAFQVGAIRSPVEIWLTDGYDSEVRLTQQQALNFRPGIGMQKEKITLDSSHEYQEILGFGAALTDSSAYLIHEVLDDANYTELMQNLFNRTSGIGLSYIRLPIGPSDCSLTWYSFDDTAPDLSDFSIAHDESYIIPLLQDALVINPDLKIMASPWSAPGWMKIDNDVTDPATKGLIGGRLNESMHDIYANYLVKFIQAYDAHGIDIDTITLQNEPFHEPEDYPGMPMNVSQQTDFVQELGSSFEVNNIDTEILILDHNWNLVDEAVSVLENDEARSYISGVAWHGYSSPNPSVQADVHNLYPNIGQYFTEVTGFNAAPHFHDNLAWLYENIFIGSVKNWGKTAMLWNLALNETGGPILRPYYDMRGVVTIDQTDPEPVYEVEYFALGQISKFVSQGATRVKTTGFSTDLLHIGFKNPDGSKVLIVCNADSSSHQFSIRFGFDCLDYSVNPKSVITFVWT